MATYNVTGMSCAACSARVEQAVSKVSGVTACSVNLLTNSMAVEGSAPEDAIIRAVQDAGYGATPKGKHPQKISDDDLLTDQETPGLKKRLISSLCFLIPLMYVSMGHTMCGFPLPSFLSGDPVAIALIQMLLCITVMVINQTFFVSGFKSLLHRAPNMDTLIALGSSAAFLYSTCVLFAMTKAQRIGDPDAVMGYAHGLYFESAAMILTLITVGKMLEARSKGKTTNALKGLMKLTPQTAKVIQDGAEIEIPVEDVAIGDIFAVYPGDSIPVDGIVTEGSSAVNESALTGESIPVDKAENDRVSAGTLNQSGFLKCRATRVGSDTTLSQIIRLVSDASAGKAPIAKIADKVSGIFVPVVMGIAAVTICIWLLVGQSFGFALERGISVLVISCPCALGLATPVAIMVGSGVGAKNGILFKTAVSLEQTGKTQIVVLDKTGTVTQGAPKVTDVIPTEETEALLSLASSLERKSEHPLAKAIMEYAEHQGVETFEISGFQAHPGNGLSARHESVELLGGNMGFIHKKVQLPTAFSQQAECLASEGKTPMFFAKGDTLLGMIAVADVIRPDSKKAVEELKNMGIQAVMLTGDNERTANAIARQAGIDTVIASVLPEGKEKTVFDLKQGGQVLMVGDGINDAPALTTADIGIAIGAGTDIAMDAADILLTKSSLKDLPAAIRLSRATLKNIHQNLFWAFIYNVIGIPLAAGVWIPVFGWRLSPMFGAAAMSLSSFCVVTNALRLNLCQIYDGKHDKKIKQKWIKKEQDTMKKVMTIQGMMCEHCEARVKKTLEAVDGVESAVVSHQTGTAEVTLTPDVSDEILKKAVEDQDYTVIEVK